MTRVLMLIIGTCYMMSSLITAALLTSSLRLKKFSLLYHCSPWRAGSLIFFDRREAYWNAPHHQGDHMRHEYM
jgi:hypothetical protein